MEVWLSESIEILKTSLQHGAELRKQKTTLEQRVGVYRVTDFLALLLVVTSAHGAKVTKLLVTCYKSRQWHPTIHSDQCILHDHAITLEKTSSFILEYP